MNNDVLVKAEGVKKKFCRNLMRSMLYGLSDSAAEIFGGTDSHDRLRPHEFWANNDISFELRRGECLGLIGHNGAGKTTLLKMLNGLIKPDHGTITMHGRVGALIALGAGFNPILTGRENIYVNGAVLGLGKREIDGKIEEIIDFAGIREFIDTPTHSYSSGMTVRLGFSIAVNLLNPDVLILDEVLAVGDAAFRAKCEMKIGEIIRKAAVIFVSHEATHIRRMCDRVLWLDHGRPKAIGETSQILQEYEKEGQRRTGSPVSSMTRLPEITSVTPVAVPERIAYGETLKFSVRIQSTRPVPIGFIVLGIAQGGTAAAQTNITASKVIDGEQTLQMEIGPLFLKNGPYALNFSLYGRSYKELVVRYMAFAEFQIDSGFDGHCFYQIPATVHLT